MIVLNSPCLRYNQVSFPKMMNVSHFCVKQNLISFESMSIRMSVSKFGENVLSVSAFTYNEQDNFMLCFRGPQHTCERGVSNFLYQMMTQLVLFRTSLTFHIVWKIRKLAGR